MQFVEGGLDMGCIWPVFWQIRQNEPRAERRAWFNYTPPYEPRPAYEVVRLLSAAAGGTRLTGRNLDTEQATPTLAVRNKAGDVLHVFVFNKRHESTPFTLDAAALGLARELTIHGFSESKGLLDPDHEAIDDDRRVTVDLPAMSLMRIDLELRN
jgi:hypothetical protein